MNIHLRGGPSASVSSLGIATVAFVFGWLPSGLAAAQGLPAELGTQKPLWLWVIGSIILGAAIVYGIMRNRNRTRSERAATDQATKGLYAREDHDNSGR
jgi:hypothetical protein